MRYLSICSGIEAATVAWHPLGWEPVAFAEIEKFPCAVLAHHYPSVPNWGDITKYREWPDAAIDLLVGGTPCQSFSVAGLRQGLADPRGNLALIFPAIAARYRPAWVVWENVPGVLSSHGGRDFASFLGALSGQQIEPPADGWRNSGVVVGISDAYSLAWRVLDAQYFGLAQRRARVFVVGHLGDWRRAAAVLFERESLSGHPAPRREAGERVTGTLSSRTSAGGGLGTDFEVDGGLIPSTGDISHCLNAGGMGRIDYETETLIVHALDSVSAGQCTEDGTGCGTQIVPIAYALGSHAGAADGDQTNGLDVSEELAYALRASRTQAVAFAENQRGELVTSDTMGALKAAAGGKPGQGYPAVAFVNTAGDTALGMSKPGAVRRLTPLECERLMGLPDHYTAVPYRGKLAADGPRYRALGNSMAVPVIRWIGERIALVEQILKELAA